MNKKKIIIISAILFFIILIYIAIFIFNCNSLTLIQLSTTNNDRMMGYIIITEEQNVIVIDGGNYEDGTKLENYIKDYGGEVDMWFLTHYHRDHTGAIRYILDNTDVKINKLYYDLNSKEEVEKYEEIRLPDYNSLIECLERNKTRYNKKEIKLGDEIKYDNLNIKVLGTKNSDIVENLGNNSSVVLKFATKFDTKILFLGDTGIQSEEKILSKYKEEVQNVEYIQMAHHGQGGVSENFYKIANPDNCMWPTPEWLWNNDSGNGYNSGPWKTLETRSWMDKLNVKNYVAKDKDILLKIF